MLEPCNKPLAREERVILVPLQPSQAANRRQAGGLTERVRPRLAPVQRDFNGTDQVDVGVPALKRFDAAGVHFPCRETFEKPLVFK